MWAYEGPAALAPNYAEEHGVSEAVALPRVAQLHPEPSAISKKTPTFTRSGSARSTASDRLRPTPRDRLRSLVGSATRIPFGRSAIDDAERDLVRAGRFALDESAEAARLELA
jgi:hypothetical protein